MKNVTNILLIISVAFVYAQSPADLNPSYPRIAMDYFDRPVHSWSNGTKIDMLAGFDMVIIPGTFDTKVDVLVPILRNQDPDQILLGMGVNGVNIFSPSEYFLVSSYRATLLEDLAPGDELIKLTTTEGLPDDLIHIRINEDVIGIRYRHSDTLLVATPSGEYAVNANHAKGDTVFRVYRVLGQGFRPNFGEYCPFVDGDQVWDFLAKKNVIKEMQWNYRLLDGIFHDYFRVLFPSSRSDFDFDINGIDDRVEHGTDWIEAQWKHGMDLWLQAEADLMAQEAPDLPNLLSVNTGSSLHQYYDIVNGHCFEGYQRFTTWRYIHNDVMNWMTQGIQPQVIFFLDYFAEKHFWNGKNRFNKVRFGLSHAMITECYYGYTGGDTYLYWFWYDEYETDMGYPTSDVQTLNGEEFLLLRYFDNGCVICNGTGSDQVVDPSQLQGGPYYRLKGGQDPAFNTGELVTEPIELYGYNYGNHNLRGDGILLFKQPTTAVCDIIVDNFFMNATSPGSDAVRLDGPWQKKSAAGFQDFTQNNPFWAISGSTWKLDIPNYDVDGANGVFDENYGYHAVNPGSEVYTATYYPTIGVPGWYEVSEWHGWHGDYPETVPEATNVPFEICVGDTVKIRGTINQQINYGQWNRLGFVELPAGKEGYVRISTKGVNGTVIADAVKFHYLGDDVVPDSIPPQPPTNVRVY